jgi:uncharacterized protein CbrC (UPF0167 family)
MAHTFTELGIPFPLFEASTEGTEYVGLADCCLCRRSNQPAFRLGIGNHIMLTCPSCQTVNGLDADDREDTACRTCKTTLAFPLHHPLTPKDANGEFPLYACYECLRQGKAALGKDTEVGMITWEQAVNGVTHGVPGLSQPGYEMVETYPAEGEWEAWYGVRLPSEWMWELLRTPTYSTWQGEQWQFCCQRPMIFIGEWKQEDFTRNAPDGDGLRYALETQPDLTPEVWGWGACCFYMFRCPECRSVRGHYDMD